MKRLGWIICCISTGTLAVILLQANNVCSFLRLLAGAVLGACGVGFAWLLIEFLDGVMEHQRKKRNRVQRQTEGIAKMFGQIQDIHTIVSRNAFVVGSHPVTIDEKYLDSINAKFDQMLSLFVSIRGMLSNKKPRRRKK